VQGFFVHGDTAETSKDSALSAPVQASSTQVPGARGDKKLFRQILYFLFVILTIFFLNFLGDKVFDIDKLLESYEWKTYDLRIKTYYNLNKDKPNKVKKVNPNIVIVSIDNASLDVLESDLGRWPWTRDVWTDTINYLTNDGVDILNFDMMFVGYQKGFENRDIKLAEKPVI